MLFLQRIWQLLNPSWFNSLVQTQHRQPNLDLAAAAAAAAEISPCRNPAGIALRVPTPNVSVVDLVLQVEKKTFAEEVNEAFREAARGPSKGARLSSAAAALCNCSTHRLAHQQRTCASSRA